MNPIHTHVRCNQDVFRFLVTFLLLILFIPLTTSAQEPNITLTAGFTNDGIPTLMGPDGHTLYTFALDEDGTSTCYDECAEEWMPLVVEANIQPVAGEGIPGEFSTIERKDGSFQVTYNGAPLYYYHEDEAGGDANGQGEADVWFAANPATVMMSHKAGLGDILIGPGGLTLYVFLEDEIEDGQGESYCYEECEVAWPALILPEGTEPSAGLGVMGELGTTERLDGSRQVTYNGYPLYFFKKDTKPGDTTGNALKDVWYVAMADGVMPESLSVGVDLVARGFTSPVALVAAHDGSGRLFVADMVGKIWIITAEGEVLPDPFLDISDQLVEFMPGYDERGLLGLAFPVDYATSGLFYVYYSAPLRPEAPPDWDHTNILSEFRVSADNPNLANPQSERIVLAIDQPQFNHNAGHIAFGLDGYLYIPIGDGGGGNDTDLGHTPALGNAQDTTNLHGNILRIDVNGDPYAIPSDNPFVGEGDNVADEIYAYGLRNPYHISFDGNGQLYAADAGQELFEEVDLIMAGGNYGWNIREGRHCFDPNAPEQPPADCPETGANGEALQNPMIEYDHRWGNVVVGGYIYRGSASPDLAGSYVFGSFAMTAAVPSGRLFSARPDENGSWTMHDLNLMNTEDGKLGAYLLGFGEDDNGELYVLTTQMLAPVGETGKVWRLSANTEPIPPDPTPEVTVEPMPERVSAQDVPTLNSAYTTEGIPTLVDSAGMTLYTFAFDDEGFSTCYDMCAQMWMPLTVLEGTTPSGGEGVTGEIGTVLRENGSPHVTYNGAPLYYYHEDEAPGDAKGQGAEDVWFAANPATVMLSQDGTHLVGPGGLTLYLFTVDEGSESYCYEECAVAWPPLVVLPDMQPLLGAGITGELGVTARHDGEMQVTFNGIPLYFFRGDMKPGDTTGDGLKEVWYTVTPDSVQSTDEPADTETEEPAEEDPEEPMATEES